MPLKICLVSQEYPPETNWGGIGTYTYILAHNLTKLGHVVHVVARSTNNKSYTYLDGDVVVHRIHQPVLSCTITIKDALYLNHLTYSQAVNDKIQELHEKIGFDIVEFPDFAAEAFQFQGNIPYVLRLHTCHAIVQYFNNIKMQQQDLMINYMEKIAAMKATRIVAPTPKVLELTKKFWDMDIKKYDIIPNPADVKRDYCGNYERLDLIPRIMYYGRFEPIKGLDLLINALFYVIKEVPDAKLTLIGRDTPYGPNGSSYLSEIYKKICSLNISPRNIRIINQWQSKDLVYRHIHNSDVCVVPSIYDNFPYTVIEPLTCGKPVLLTDSVGISYYLKHGEEAFISKNDPKEFAEYIIRLLKDKDLLQYIGKNAKRAVKRFEADKVVPQIVDMYKKVISEYRDLNVVKIVNGEKDNLSVKSNKKLSICIICYNALDYTKRCIDSIRRTTKVPYKIHVLDNGSTDGTKEFLNTIKNDPDIEVIFEDKNVGVPAGRNLLIKKVKLNDYVVFLDNDVEVFDGWYIPFYEQLEKDSSIGILGVEGYDIFVIGGTRNLKPVSSGKADIITGYCMFMKKELIEKIGLFDEKLGYYWHDDDDYSVRAIGEGYVNIVVKANLYHYGSKSSTTKSDILKLEKSKANLVYLTQKWRDMGIIDENGRPCRKKIKIIWEGPQFVYSSLAHVNREICLELSKKDFIDLKIISSEIKQFDENIDPRLIELSKRKIESLSSESTYGFIDYFIQHQWPPKFKPLRSGKWILMQPWEFGLLPKEWLVPMCKEIDEIWVPSTYNKRCYIESGVPAEKVHVIPNGVNVNIFKPNGELFPLKTNKKFKFGFVGGTIWRKGIDILLKAYLKTFSKKDDVTLIIKDNGVNTFYKGQTLSEYIRKLQEDPNNPEIIYITEDLSTEEMASLYRTIDCLVHPYRGEGFGMPIAEAMASGKPVIVTNFGAALDFCDESNSYLIPATVRKLPKRKIGSLETVGDPFVAEPDFNALCDILRKVYNTPKDQLKLKGENGREKILSAFTWKHTVEKIIERLKQSRNTPIARYGVYLSDKDSLKLINEALERIYTFPLQALDYLYTALELNSSNEFLMKKTIECMLNLKRFQEAKNYIDKLYTVLLNKYGNLNENISLLGKINYSEYYELIGLYYYHCGDKKNAEDCFETAKKVNPYSKTKNMFATLSLCLITKDEEKNIARCINSVKDIVDEIVVVDTGSKDRTVEIAQNLGARVVHAKWEDDYSKARNIAIENATSDWILFLDADEEIKKEDIGKIRPLLNDDTVEAYMFKIVNYGGASVSSGLTEIHYNFRLFRNNGKIKYIYPIHENLMNIEENRMPVFKKADITILHYGYLNETRIEKNKTERYINILLRYLMEHPDDKFQHGNLAVEYFNAGDYNKALKHLLIATKGMDVNLFGATRLLRYLIQTYIALKDYDTALKLINDAKAYYIDIPDFKFLEGMLYITQKRYKKAIEMFKECLSMGEYEGLFITMGGTGSYRARYMIALCYEKLGRLHDAVKEYIEILKTNPNYQDVFVRLFDLFVRNEKPESVKEFFDKYVDKRNPANFAILAKLYMNIRRFDIAKEYLDEVDMDIAGLNTLKGIACMGMKDYQKAIGFFDKEHEKAKSDAIYHKILCYLILKEPEMARRILWEIEDSADKKLFLTIIGEIKASYDEVKDSYFKLLEKLIQFSEFDLFNELLKLYSGLFTRDDYVRYGHMMKDKGFDELAVTAYIKAADLNCEDPDVYTYLAQKALEQNMTDEAFAFAAKAFNIDGMDVDNYALMYRIYKVTGRNDEADRVSKSIKEIYPEIELEEIVQ